MAKNPGWFIQMFVGFGSWKFACRTIYISARVLVKTTVWACNTSIHVAFTANIGKVYCILFTPVAFLPTVHCFNMYTNAPIDDCMSMLVRAGMIRLLPACLEAVNFHWSHGYIITISTEMYRHPHWKRIFGQSRRTERHLQISSVIDGLVSLRMFNIVPYHTH